MSGVHWIALTAGLVWASIGTISVLIRFGPARTAYFGLPRQLGQPLGEIIQGSDLSGRLQAIGQPTCLFGADHIVTTYGGGHDERIGMRFRSPGTPGGRLDACGKFLG